MRPAGRACVAGFACLVLATASARAQAPPATSDDDEGFTIRDSTVGYIDGAIPGNQFRLRYDSAYNLNRPNRAEFFYARGAPAGPGVPLAETRIDYQDVSTYAEAALGRRLSVFAEVPVRFLNPEVNANTAGLADVNAGFKYAFCRDADTVATFQFRTYAPTGDASRGLGNRHTSLEPALLLYHRLNDRLSFEGEFRYWAPVGGTDFAGDLVRYGTGLSYDLFRTENIRVRPVVEFVGWTVLGGKQTDESPARDDILTSAAGNTIVNAKLGVRTAVGDRVDFYAGYGRALTGVRWYEDTFRLEMRVAF